MVGFEVTPTIASSRIIRSSSPVWSISRDRKSIQTLWPSSDNWWSRDLDIDLRTSLLDFRDLLKSGLVRLTAVEACVQEGAHQVDRQRRADDLRAEAEYVHVVVLDP